MTICESCGAVEHGNAFCSTCRRQWSGGDPLTADRNDVEEDSLRGEFLRLIVDELMEQATK